MEPSCEPGFGVAHFLRRGSSAPGLMPPLLLRWTVVTCGSASSAPGSEDRSETGENKRTSHIALSKLGGAGHPLVHYICISPIFNLVGSSSEARSMSRAIRKSRSAVHALSEVSDPG
jgi:hypothetical protein